MSIGYEMVDRQFAIIISSNIKCESDDGFVKNAHKISRILPGFICTVNFTLSLNDFSLNDTALSV